MIHSKTDPIAAHYGYPITTGISYRKALEVEWSTYTDVPEEDNGHTKEADLSYSSTLEKTIYNPIFWGLGTEKISQ